MVYNKIIPKNSYKNVFFKLFNENIIIILRCIASSCIYIIHTYYIIHIILIYTLPETLIMTYIVRL